MLENIEIHWEPTLDQVFIEQIKEIFTSAFLGKKTSTNQFYPGAYSQISLQELSLKNITGQQAVSVKRTFLHKTVESEIEAITQKPLSYLGVCIFLF